MKKLTLLIVLLSLYTVSYGQYNVGIFSGTGIANNSEQPVRLVAGAQALNKIGKRIYLGATISYEPYEFIKRTGAERHSVSDKQTYNVNADLFFISPTIGIATGKRQNLRFYLLPGIGIAAGYREYMTDYLRYSTDQTLARDTMQITRGLKSISFRPAVQVQKLFPVGKNISVTAGALFGITATKFTDARLWHYSNAVKVSPVYYYSLTAGVTYRFEK